MRELIGEHLKEASLHRTAPPIAETAPPHDAPVAVAKAPAASAVSRPDPTPTASVTASGDAHAVAGDKDPIKPLLVKTITYRTAPVQTASLAPMPMLMPVPASAPAPVAALAAAQQSDPLHTLVAAADAAGVAKAPAPQAAPAEPAKAELATAPPASAQPVATTPIAPQPLAAPPPVAAQPVAPQPVASQPAAAEPVKTQAVAPDIAETEAPEAETTKAEAAIPSAAPAHAHGGWLIQIGAYDDEDQAKQHLSAAQLKVGVALKAADPFTERIQKGDKAMYRARFAGFDRATAEAACRQLKRSDFECMALKD